MLNVKKLIGKLLSTPIVIEQGTSGMWTYRKWSNGTAECWGNKVTAVAANTVDVNTYVDYPFTFSDLPTTEMTISAGGADLYRGHVIYGSSNTSQVRLCLINKHTASINILSYLYVVGKVAVGGGSI